jgi:hypothetical protein
MKYKSRYRLIACAFAVIFLGLMVGQTTAAPGAAKGSDGFPWGASREDLGPLKYIGRDESGNVLYEKPGDAGYYGRARVSGIEYGFRNERLAIAIFKVDSLLQYLLLKDEAIKRYGKGEDIPGAKDSYTWNRENTTISLVGHFAES